MVDRIFVTQGPEKVKEFRAKGALAESLIFFSLSLYAKESLKNSFPIRCVLYNGLEGLEGSWVLLFTADQSLLSFPVHMYYVQH